MLCQRELGGTITRKQRHKGASAFESADLPIVLIVLDTLNVVQLILDPALDNIDSLHNLDTRIATRLIPIPTHSPSQLSLQKLAPSCSPALSSRIITGVRST